MNERLRNWHPTPAEVKDIVVELRPLIHDLARREQQAIRGAVRRADRAPVQRMFVALAARV